MQINVMQLYNATQCYTNATQCNTTQAVMSLGVMQLMQRSGMQLSQCYTTRSKSVLYFVRLVSELWQRCVASGIIHEGVQRFSRRRPTLDHSAQNR